MSTRQRQRQRNLAPEGALAWGSSLARGLRPAKSTYALAPNGTLRGTLSKLISRVKNTVNHFKHFSCPFEPGPSNTALEICLPQSIGPIKNTLPCWACSRASEKAPEINKLLLQQAAAQRGYAHLAEHVCIRNATHIGWRNAQDSPDTSRMETVKLLSCCLTRPHGQQAVKQSTDDKSRKHFVLIAFFQGGMLPNLL